MFDDLLTETNFFIFFFFIFIFLLRCDLVYSIVLFPRIEPVGEPYSEVCFHPELWFGMVSQPNSLSKRLERWIEHVLDYCRDGKKYVVLCCFLSYIVQLADIKDKKKKKKTWVLVGFDPRSSRTAV